MGRAEREERILDILRTNQDELRHLREKSTKTDELLLKLGNSIISITKDAELRLMQSEAVMITKNEDKFATKQRLDSKIQHLITLLEADQASAEKEFERIDKEWRECVKHKERIFTLGLTGLGMGMSFLIWLLDRGIINLG